MTDAPEGGRGCAVRSPAQDRFGPARRPCLPFCPRSVPWPARGAGDAGRTFGQRGKGAAPCCLRRVCARAPIPDGTGPRSHCLPADRPGDS
jgi:hypothetical protein